MAGRRPRSALFDYQTDAVRVAVERKRVALLLAPGMGKTAITLTALLDLDAWPTLVVAPAQTARYVWREEAMRWEHLDRIGVRPIIGTAAARAKLLDASTAHVEVVSYENLIWLSDRVDLGRRYRSIVFDELSKMKTPGSKRSRRMRSGQGGTRIPVRFGLTGSPVGNHLLDLWGEMAVIGGPAPLGRTFGGYRDQYFQVSNTDGQGRPVSWVLQGMERVGRRDWGHTSRSRATEREIHERVAPWAFALPPQPSAGIPPVRVNPIRVPMPEAALRATAELRKQMHTILDDGAEVDALTPGARAAKLRQIAGGAVFATSGPEWGEVHAAKLDALDDLLDELQGEPLLLFYWYTHERDRILARLAGRRTATIATPRWVDRWNAREFEVLVAHPQSAGHGINLQGGGSNVAWYSLPYWELFAQGNGRLARPGQAAPFVMAHILLCGDVDDRLYAGLDEKRDTESDLIAAVTYADLL